MSNSTALEFTIDKQISRTFRSVDLSQLVYKPLKYFEKILYQLRKIYGSKRPGYMFVPCEFQCCAIAHQL